MTRSRLWGPALALVLVAAVGAVFVLARGGDEAAEAPTTTPRRTADGWEWAADGGVVEVSRWERGTAPTADQRAAGEELAHATRAAVADIVTVADAAAAGYVVRDEGDGHGAHDGAAEEAGGDAGTVHLVHPDLVADGRSLDPEHPEALVLDAATDVVYGAMFIAEPDAVGEQVSPEAPWHYHFFDKAVCFYDDGDDLRARAVLAVPAPCPDGRVETHRSLEMLHVWLVANPGGDFASEMLLSGRPGELDRVT